MSKRTDWKRIDETVRNFLGLRYHLVGVKISKDSKVIEDARPEKPMAYCNALRVASQGDRVISYGKRDEGCPTAEVILGFRTPRYGGIEPRINPSETMNVLVAPLHRIEEEPDVVHAILTPKQMMDLSIILQSDKEGFLDVGFRGEASCAEFTAKPYMEGRPNVSMLCNGARVVYSDFRDSELVFGAPPETFLSLTNKIEEIEKSGGTLCGCVTSDIPREIVEEFEKMGFSKGTDYFFGKIERRNVRVYLNKDPQGRIKLVTTHLSVRTASEDQAKEALAKLQQYGLRPYRSSARGIWLDITATTNVERLGVDLFDGVALKQIVERAVNNLSRHIGKAGVVA